MVTMMRTDEGNLWSRWVQGGGKSTYSTQFLTDFAYGPNESVYKYFIEQHFPIVTVINGVWW